METSSPLAAMRPAAPSFGRRDLFGSQAHMASNPLGPGTLHLRDQFVQRSHPDYFNIKAVRGSPTATLAADLSQNFNITEASPRFPTPRRALFTAASMMGQVDGREYVTTPPLHPSSSPAPTSDMMDVSPLPHKMPYASQADTYSPTPGQYYADAMMIESPISRQVSMESPKPAGAERRKLGLRRSSITRHKGHAAIFAASRPSADHQLGSSRNDAGWASSSGSSIPLSECFEDSPPRPQTANSPSAAAAAAAGGAASRSKPQFASLSGMGGRSNGSPVAGHARRPSNPFLRPRKQCRRSLSMFENPADVMKTKAEENSPPAAKLQSVMDIEEPSEPVLPHYFAEGQDDSIPRITRETMIDVLDGRFCELFEQKMVIDCRFEYEYEGGHIDGAINYNDKELLAAHLFHTPMQGRTLLIFHCEYSAHRAPIMARHVRAEDRTANAEFYPRLTYPDVYILEGGYSGFFSEHRDRCYPQAYVEMGDAQHVHTCEREMGRLRQNRKGLGRAQTFAFGQHHGAGAAADDSPSAAAARPGNRESLDAMLGESPILGTDRCHARRMASY